MMQAPLKHVRGPSKQQAMEMQQHKKVRVPPRKVMGKPNSGSSILVDQCGIEDCSDIATKWEYSVARLVLKCSSWAVVLSCWRKLLWICVVRLIL